MYIVWFLSRSTFIYQQLSWSDLCLFISIANFTVGGLNASHWRPTWFQMCWIKSVQNWDWIIWSSVWLYYEQSGGYHIDPVPQYQRNENKNDNQDRVALRRASNQFSCNISPKWWLMVHVSPSISMGCTSCDMLRSHHPDWSALSHLSALRWHRRDQISGLSSSSR